MREKDFQTKFGAWLKAKWPLSGAFELKLCKTKSLAYSAVKDHQIAALLSANSKGRGLYYKISDSGIGYKPFDAFILRETPAYVVIQFWRPGVKTFYMIPVTNFVTSKANSLRKSLTEADCARIGVRCEL